MCMPDIGAMVHNILQAAFRCVYVPMVVTGVGGVLKSQILSFVASHGSENEEARSRWLSSSCCRWLPAALGAAGIPFCITNF